MKKVFIATPNHRTGVSERGTQAVRAGNLILVGGIMSLDEAGKVVGADIATQTRNVFDSLRRICGTVATLMDVPLMAAAQNVVPVARTAAEAVDKLRTWASGRWLSADQPGIYQRAGESAGKSRRTIPRDPSVN